MKNCSESEQEQELTKLIIFNFVENTPKIHHTMLAIITPELHIA